MLLGVLVEVLQNVLQKQALAKCKKVLLKQNKKVLRKQNRKVLQKQSATKNLSTLITEMR